MVQKKNRFLDRSRTFCFSLLLLLIQTPFTQAQNIVSIPDLIKTGIKSEAPTWSLVSVHARTKEGYTYFVLRHDAQQVGIHVNEYAEQVPEITWTSLATAAPRERTELKDIGDEAYLIGNSPHAGVPMFDVVFRKGKVLVHIEARSAETALHFAELVAEMLPR